MLGHGTRAIVMAKTNSCDNATATRLNLHMHLLNERCLRTKVPSTEGAEAKKPASKSCGQVNVGVAESVKVHSPDVPGVPHKTQEEPQKPKATPLRLPAEGEPCEYEQETAEIVMIAESMVSGIVALPMEVETPMKWSCWMRNRRRGPVELTRRRESAWKSAKTSASALTQ